MANRNRQRKGRRGAGEGTVYQQRRRRAKVMRREGAAVRQIAAALDTDTETARGWVGSDGTEE